MKTDGIHYKNKRKTSFSCGIDVLGKLIITIPLDSKNSIKATKFREMIFSEKDIVFIKEFISKYELGV